MAVDGPLDPQTQSHSRPPSSSHDALNFKPLTEGLGFHLFADGLPYAPRSNSPTPPSRPSHTAGAGANSAGRPIFAFPETPPQPARPEPLPRELQNLRDQLRGPVAPIGRPTVSPAVTARAASPVTERLAELESHGIGYVLKRLFAYLIDLLFAGSLCGAVLSVALLNVDGNRLGAISLQAMLTAAIFLFGCVWAAIAAQEVAFGTTIGKRIFNLHLRGSGMEVFLRAVFFIPSLLFSGLGILMCLADSRKRCWHDRVTQIQPESR